MIILPLSLLLEAIERDVRDPRDCSIAISEMAGGRIRVVPNSEVDGMLNGGEPGEEVSGIAELLDDLTNNPQPPKLLWRTCLTCGRMVENDGRDCPACEM